MYYILTRLSFDWTARDAVVKISRTSGMRNTNLYIIYLRVYSIVSTEYYIIKFGLFTVRQEETFILHKKKMIIFNIILQFTVHKKRVRFKKYLGS